MHLHQIFAVVFFPYPNMCGIIFQINPAIFNNGLRKLNVCSIYTQMTEIAKFQSMKIPRKLEAVRRWYGYKVVLHYDLIIPYNKKELSNELNSSWAMISKLRMREYEKAQKDNKQPSRLNVFQGCYTLQYIICWKRLLLFTNVLKGRTI